MFRAGSVWSEWPSAGPLAFPDEGDAEGVPSALARGIVPKWAEANHRVAIDGVAVKLPDSQALHCQPQLRTWRGKNCRRMVMYSAGAILSATVETWPEKTLNNEAALRVVAYAIRR